MFHLESGQSETAHEHKGFLQSGLFEALPTAVTNELAIARREFTLEKNQSLMVQNDPADWFYYIVSGWVKLFRETRGGDEAVIELLGAGEFVGENTFFEGNIYSSDAAAIEPTEIIRFPSSLLKEALATSHATAVAMLQIYAHKNERQTRELESLKLQGTPQRIGCFLLRECKGQKAGTHSLELPYGKSLVAAKLGMKGETFSRALAKLKAATQIEIRGSKIWIPDIARLASYVCSGCSNEYPCKDLVRSTH